MENYATRAVHAVFDGELAFCKFLAANDTGLTGGHQAGIYISKPSIPILFSEPGIKGTNKERWVKIKWHDGTITDTRFIYYGQGTRNEYRITNFGRGFPFLRPEYTGALFVLIRSDAEDYQGFVLNTDDEIEQFLSAFGLTPAETNKLIDPKQTPEETKEKLLIDRYVASLTEDFPSSEEMSLTARKINDAVFGHADLVVTNPDKKILEWTDAEYRLFKALEHARYGDNILKGFDNFDTFVSAANQIINRRKSRAGKSLEHHLAAVFDANCLLYTSQAVTEGNKRPDFLFPSQAAYHNSSFPADKLISLAAKTTCKDRWRQVLNEADRLRGKTKFLCTLQQGISETQMDEMQTEKVTLVVPEPYIRTYPRSKQSNIWTLSRFVAYVKETENG